MTFRLPPLVLRVSSLQGVPDWCDAHPKGFLLPEDVRRDALYQALARRTQRLQRVLAALVLLTMLGLGTLAGLWGMRSAPVRSAKAAAPAVVAPTLTAAAEVAQPPTRPTPASSPSGPPIAAAAVVPAIVQPVAPARGALLASVPRVVSAPAKAPTATAARPGASGSLAVQPAQNDARSQVLADWPVSAVAAQHEAGEITITDCFGVNTAAMLSSNGGRTGRTYRVGDALPDGEVITSIDTNRGSVTTNRRTIKK